MFTRQQKIRRRLLKSLMRKHLRMQIREQRVAEVHHKVYCWRCRQTLYSCACPISDMELWFN